MRKRQQSRKLEEKSTKQASPVKVQRSSQVFQVFSSNPEKRWCEKWYLLYSLIWPLVYGFWVKSKLHVNAGDVGNLSMSIGTALPNILIPLFFNPHSSKKAFTKTYGFKFNLWILTYAFTASYFFTEYFFDALGMVYKFPHLKWNFDSILLGSGKQVVPVMMYFHAWYFFVTYHALSIVFIRSITSLLSKIGTPLLSWIISTVFSAWFFSWAEIYFTTMEEAKDFFTYQDMDWALKEGAWMYACYFIVSFPMIFWLDETIGNEWSIRRTLESSLASGMLSFILLDIVCQYFITGWIEKRF